MLRSKLPYLLMGFFGVFMTFTHPAFAQTATTDYVVFYRNEFTFGLCVLVLFISSWLSMKLPAEKGETDLEPSIKFITAMLGGILAFIYCLHKDKDLTLLNPIWVAVVAIVLPVAILNIRSRLKDYTSKMKFKKDGE